MCTDGTSLKARGHNGCGHYSTISEGHKRISFYAIAAIHFGLALN